MTHELDPVLNTLLSGPISSLASKSGEPAYSVLMAQAPSSPFSNSMIPVLLVGAIFLFVVILPQRRQEKQRQARLDAVKAGDEVVTRGGIIGKVHSTKEDGVLVLQISERTRIRVVRSEITDLYNQGAAASSSSGPAKATPSPSAESKK